MDMQQCHQWDLLLVVGKRAAPHLHKDVYFSTDELMSDSNSSVQNKKCHGLTCSIIVTQIFELYLTRLVHLQYILS